MRINVDLAIFQPYLDLGAGDNQTLKIQVARPGIEPRSSCSASQELNHSATAAPNIYWIWRSKVKVTIDIYGNELVITIKAEQLCASSSNLTDQLPFMRGWPPLLLEVKGQGHNEPFWKYVVNINNMTEIISAGLTHERISPIDFQGHSLKGQGHHNDKILKYRCEHTQNKPLNVF